MVIDGIQKLTLLDYPEKIACTVFTHGCNFRCPFCHNASLVTSNDNAHISIDELKVFFEKRKGILDGVCVTGGEPLLQKDIKEFLELIKSYGYLVKLDTNGSNPQKLKELVECGLVDFLAMDIKSSLKNYGKTAGVEDFDVEPIKRSAEFIMNCGVEYEFRTTVVRELHCEQDFAEIGEWLKGCKRYYLQQFVDSGDVISGGMSAYTAQEMETLRQALLVNIPVAELRGV